MEKPACPNVPVEYARGRVRPVEDGKMSYSEDTIFCAESGSLSHSLEEIQGLLSLPC